MYTKQYLLYLLTGCAFVGMPHIYSMESASTNAMNSGQYRLETRTIQKAGINKTVEILWLSKYIDGSLIWESVPYPRIERRYRQNRKGESIEHSYKTYTWYLNADGVWYLK
jgi:hypothetical protein